MDGRPTHLADKVLPPPLRPPLITPSASPPGSRVFSRIPDRPPKRTRLSSTPSSSASAQLPAAQPPDLRLESSSRLFAFWDQLATRYNKPLDEDDIVDLRDLDFVKDRGVTRAATKSYEIGTLTNADADDTSSQGAGDENETSAGEENVPEDDDSADELDLISPPVTVVVQEKLQYYKNWYVPPADEQDPEDAEAFREFEEAEKRRKELYGDEEEEEEEEDDPVVDTSDQADEVEVNEAVRGEQEEPSPLDEDEEENENRRSPSPPRRTPRRRKSEPPHPPAEPDSSEDELAAWEIDDTPIPPRRSVPPPDDIIDLTLSRSPSPAPPPRGRSQSRPRGSVAPPVRSQSQPRARAKSKSRPQEPVRPRSASPLQILQLLTPPRSSCSAPGDPPEMTVVPARAETPSPKMPRPRPRFFAKSRSPCESQKEDGPSSIVPASPVPDVIGSPQPPKTSKKLSRASMIPEVVISVPRGGYRPKTPMRSSSPDVPSSASVRSSQKAKQDDEAVSSTSVRLKGKGKAAASRAMNPEPPPMPSSSRRKPSPPRGVTEESCSPQYVPPRGRKRRRVASSSASDASPEKSSSSNPSPRKQPFSGAGRRSGYSSAAPPPTSSPVHIDHEDDPPLSQLGRDHHRSRSEAPIPAPPIFPPVYPPFNQRPDHHRTGSVAPGAHLHPPFYHANPPMTPQHSHAAMAWMSYLMASSFLPPPTPSSGSGYPPGPSAPPYYGAPHTPSHRRHLPRQSHSFDTPSSSEAGPSRSSTYSTPTHYPHSHPYWFDPGYSSGTLPPSSPIPSSPINSSPILRPASVPAGQRSQSRGRRVSFKLDGDDRPLSATTARRATHRDSTDSERASDDEGARAHGRSRRSSTPAKPSKGKGKAKARAATSDEDDEDEGDGDGQEDAERAAPKRGRARTPGPPGPPGRREAGAAHGLATNKEKTPARKK